MAAASASANSTCAKPRARPVSASVAAEEKDGEDGGTSRRKGSSGSGAGWGEPKRVAAEQQAFLRNCTTGG